MRDFRDYLRNPFSDPRLSRENKKKFGEDSIRRITTQNGDNQFDQLLLDTANVQNNLFGIVSNIGTNQAQQKARTRTVDDVIKNFTARNTRLNKFFGANGMDKTPVYLEFFPQGVMPFTEGITKANVEQRMEQMITAIANNTAVAGGPDVLAEYQGFLTSYRDLRGGQLLKISEVETGRTYGDEAEMAWDDQMFKNLLTFANLHRSDPEKLSLYMNQAILKTSKSSDNDGKGRITGLVILNPGNQPLQGTKVHVIDGNINDTTTDAQGKFTTHALPIGNYQVQFSKNGYSKTVTIEVVDEGDTAHNIEFTAEAGA